MSEIPDSDKTQLLFKEFTGVTNVKQASAFPTENFAFKDYIFSDRVFSEDIPSTLPFEYRATQLDLSGSITDDTSIDFDGTGGLPDYKLRFYKKKQLQPAESGSLKSWYLPDGNGGSLLKNSIPFKFDAVDSSYVQKCYRKITASSYFQIQMYSSPLFWLFDFKSGFLEFYGDESTLAQFFTASTGPCFSFFQYIGKTGAGGGGIDTDASFNNVDVSNNLTTCNLLVKCNLDVSGNTDMSGNLTVIGETDLSGNVDMSGNLNVVGDASFCNVLVRCNLDVSGNTDVSGNLTVIGETDLSGNVDMSGNLNVVGDASFNSIYVKTDADISGNVDVSGNINVTGYADIDGYAQVSGNLLVATDSTDLTAAGITDYNAYFRQTNMIDTMKLPFITYFDGFWKQMADRTVGGQNPWRQGDPCPFGPNLIPIAKIDINGSYSNKTTASHEPSLRPLLANTIGYFTVKFAQPSMKDWTETPIKGGEFSAEGTWIPTMGPTGTKPGYNCIPEQTIHFVAGYQEQQYDIANEYRNPKPFIKILSCSFGDIRNVNGETIIFTKSNPVTDSVSGAYTGKKIGGITRIVIAEGLIKLHPGQKGVPVSVEETQGKAWLFLEQTWAYEGWMRLPPTGSPQENILRKICGDHNIEVRLYSNNTGAKMPERPNNPPEMINANNINTDWQLLSNDLMKPYINNWSGSNPPSFLLGGLPGTAPFPPTGFSQTLFVGSQQNPPGLTIGIGETQTPQLWFVDLNVYNWPYGITTTKEIFKNTVDICGNLTVQNSIFENITVNGDLNVLGKTTLKDTIVDGTLTANTVISAGNSTLVSYKHYDNNDFTTTTVFKYDTIAVSEHESGTSDRAGYAEFHLYDNTTNADSTILVFSVSKLTSNSVAINVKEMNWNSSSQTIEKIRVKFGSVSSNRRAEIQIYHKRISNSGNPTSIDIRMYTNLSKTDLINDVLPWKLSSDNQTYSNNITEIDLTNNNGNKISSATNLYKYFDKGIMLGNNINLNSKEIQNISQLKGSNTFNNINFNNSGNLRLNAQTKLAFGTNSSTNDIEFDNSILNFNGSNIIDNLTNINLNTGNITIGNQNNNVLLDASQVEIRSKGGGPPFGDIILNNNGGGNGSIIFKNGAPTKGDIRFNASNLIGFDLSNNKLRVDEMESSTTNKIIIKDDLDLNSNDIQNLANLNITGTNLTIGTLNNRVNFKSMTNMFVDSTSNVSTKLTTVGDLAICNSPDSQKGIIFNNYTISGSFKKQYQISTGTAIYHFFNNMTSDITLGTSSTPPSKIWYYHSRFFGSAGTNNINSISPSSLVIYGYTIPFWGSLDALIINGFENALIARTSGSSSYNLKISIGIWAGGTATPSTTRYIESYTISRSNVTQNTTLLNLGECVFTRDQTMKLNSPTDPSLTSSGSPNNQVTPTNWFAGTNNLPINWNISSLSRIGLIIKIENMGSNVPIIAWEKSSLGAQTFLKMDVPWNIP